MKKAVRWGLYLLGMMTLAFGITLNTLTGLGVSPIVSVAFCSSKIADISIGDATFILYGIFILVQLILRPRGQWLLTLMQIPVNLLFSRLLNFYTAILPYDCTSHSWVLNGLLLIAAVFFTGLGVCLSVNVDLVPNPGDGIVQAIAQKIGKGQGFTKNFFDIGCVMLSCCIGLAFAGKIIGVGVGTVVAMLGVGRVIAWINHFTRTSMRRAAGLE